MNKFYRWTSTFVLAAMLLPSMVQAGVAPYPSTTTDVSAFRPSSSLASQGQFSDASTIPLAISGYAAGACVPVLVKAQNTSGKTGDLRLTLVYPFEHGTQIGVDNLEVVSATVSGDPKTSVNNLSNLSLTGSALSTATSFKLDNGVSAAATVAGPYRGDNTGSSPIKNQAELRHYDVTIPSVAAGRTAYVLTCARMSHDSNVIVDQYAIVSVKLGGQDGGKAYIAKSPAVLSASPKLTVTKVVVNDNGGIKTVADFPLSVNGSPVDSGATNEFNAGTYHVSEVSDPAYAGTFSGDCDASGTVVLANGDNKQCTLTNNDLPTKLKVTVMVVNDNGGTKTTSDFPVFVDGNAVTSGQQIDALPGFYTVTQPSTNGYAVTFSGACSPSGVATVVAGTVNECIVTDNDPSATLTIVNQVINDDGQTLSSADFPATLDGAPVDLGTAVGVQAGPHRVVGAGNGAYVTTYGGDCSVSGFVTLSEGDHKTCTVINNDAALGLTVVTHVINDDGGTAVASDFIAILQAIGSADQPLNGSETGVLIENSVGFFGVGQAFLPSGGYNVSFAGDCFGIINPGDTKVCTITDDDIAPQLTVFKNVINDNGGTSQASDFTINVTGSNVSTPSFPGSSDGTTISLNAGSYSVNEATSTLHYVKSLDSGCSGTLTVGQVATCTITNNDF